MTDSMKFGPEWLRNLSAESLSNSGLGSSNIHAGNGLQNSSSTPKNMFPEFRYGREEMLSLFDKNCNIPDILPRHKSLFIEKVQFPLAMTPCTEDEIPISAPVLNTGRPAWLQRSPVGFNSSIRGGITRGGSIDRGRLRGKPVYHSGFQRPIPTFEDDARPVPSKGDRSWTERNGEQLTNTNIGIEWNGTALTSPRREFPSHTRNLENWRRNRADDGGSDGTASGLGASGNEGWRGNSFGSSTRWGRSTSWREDDANNDGGMPTGGFIPIQRSFSTQPSDRGYGVSNNHAGKSKFETNSMVNNVPVTMNSGHSVNSTREWSNAHGGNSNDFDENLPEWATENATDVGGTFDATGAFHDITQSEGHKNSDTHKKNNSEITTITSDKHESDRKTNANEIDIEEPMQQSVSQDDSSNLPPSSDREQTEPKKIQNQLAEEMPQNNNGLHPNPSNSGIKRKLHESDSKAPVAIQNEQDLPTPNSEIVTDFKFGMNQKSVNVDMSDQMNEVTNNMIEKLIMDDDCGINNNMVVNTVEPEKSYISSPIQAVAGSVRGKQMPLYTTDVINNHVQMHNQQASNDLPQQQLDIDTGGKTIGMPHSQIMQPVPVSNELWYYRDPQSKVQGPFSAIEMTEWYRAGYFNENLFVRRVCDLRFRALGELITICNGHIPFTHSHMLPLDLENHPLNNQMMYNDYSMNLSKNDHCDELKGNVTAAANSLSHAVKNVMNSVDTTHILNMHFQMLQEQYIRHQEMMIVAELSKNECFQQLSAHEKEAIVRQKVQMLNLPDYLSSLSGLRNSLAILNPTAGNQLYDAIAQCSKKVNHFPSACHSPHSQQLNTTSPINPQCDELGRTAAIQAQSQNAIKFGALQYSPINDCEMVRKIPSETENLAGNNMINEYNLRMMLAGGQINSLSRPQNKMQEFIVPNDPTNRPDLPVEQQLSTPSDQSPLIHMWMPASNNNSQMPMVNPLPISNQNNSQWVESVLVGISNSNLDQPLDTTTNSMPQAIWNAATPENIENSQVPDQTYATKHSTENIRNEEKNNNNSQEKSPKISEKISKESNVVVPNENSFSSAENMSKVSAVSIQSNRQEKINPPNNVHNNINMKKNKTATVSSKIKDDGTTSRKNQLIEEEKRRETAEDKRRLKEDRKRQQAEEEKRRQQALEDEKKRQLLEEKERQLLIQTQRRKALMGTASSSSNGENISNPKMTKELQGNARVQSSIAPWSLQTAVATSNSGPGLAEIQKAERRERRADQQRQTEMSIAKASASAIVESNEQVLKWNAAPLPVKSFAEIQAEEAKRLAAEQIELQRRKEQEQSLTAATTNNIGNTVMNMNNIWIGNKVWNSQNTSSIWEDNTKYNNAGNSASSTSSVLATATNNAQPINLAPSGSSTQQIQAASNRNLRKSQTVSVMQSSTSSKNTAVHHVDKNINNTNKKIQSKTAAADSHDSKKNAGKKPVSTGNTQTQINNRDEFEKEFTLWCTKSLNNMNTIVDVPTFVSFLQDLESPYEVKDYIRMYLGESKETADFGKQFLERRSKYKNLQRAQNAHNDDMCKPAPALTPSGNDHSDNKGKQKKVKKSKMTKLDARILGFSVTAAEGRINVGDRDYVDGP